MLDAIQYKWSGQLLDVFGLTIKQIIVMLIERFGSSRLLGAGVPRRLRADLLIEDARILQQRIIVVFKYHHHRHKLRTEGSSTDGRRKGTVYNLISPVHDCYPAVTKYITK
jgi:hypothetical protein